MASCDDARPGVLNAQVCTGCGIGIDQDGNPRVCVDGTTVFCVDNPNFDPGDPESCPTMISTSPSGVCAVTDVVAIHTCVGGGVDVWDTVYAADTGEVPGTRLCVPIANTDPCGRQLIVPTVDVVLGGVNANMGTGILELTYNVDDGISPPASFDAASVGPGRDLQPGGSRPMVASAVAPGDVRTVCGFVTWRWIERPPLTGEQFLFPTATCVVAGGFLTP